MTSVFNIKKTIFAAAAAAALGLASAGASAAPVFNDFQVNPSAYAPGKATFTADKITGNYSEVITLNQDGSFSASLLWEAGQFVKNNGNSAVPGALTGLENQYRMYALYQASGTFVTTNGVTKFTTNPGTGNLALYLDPDFDSFENFTAPAAGNQAWTVGGLADILLAQGTPQAGSGTLDPTSDSCTSPTGGSGINCGSFGTSASFFLTDAGKAFFVDPVPFYNLSFQSGQFNTFELSGTQTTNGSLDVVFESAAVPEPGTLALLGLAVVGLGASTRRRAN